MKPVPVGRLRKRLRIEALPGGMVGMQGTPPVNAFNEQPQADPDWQLVAVRWGSIEPLTARELFLLGNQVQADVTHRIRLRYYPGFTMKCRLAWFDPNLNTTRYFNLHSVLDLEERHRLHECLAKEVV